MEWIAYWLYFIMPKLGVTCPTLSLLFPDVRGLMGQPWRTIRPPTLDVNYTPCLTRWGDDWQIWETWWDAVKANPSTASQASPHSWWAEPMSGGTAEDLYLRLSQVTGRHLCFGAAHATTSRNRRDIDRHCSQLQRLLWSSCLHWCHWGS
jgi:hypothetical protein